MFGKRRRRGLGLTGILVIIGLLWVTGAGAWLWERTLELESQCYTVLVQMGTSTGGSVCSGVGSAIKGIDGFFSNFAHSVSNGVDSVLGTFSGSASLESMFGELRVPTGLSRWGSSRDELMQKLTQGPQSLSVGSSYAEQIRTAIDSFSIGQRFMEGDGSSAYQAVPWLQQGAQVPGYGVLSQLSLGEMYRQGNSSVSADPAASIAYFSQAHRSIGLLEQSNSPQAAQMLNALPASPGKMQQEILATIRTLKAKQ